jgi:hypothetical protein
MGRLWRRAIHHRLAAARVEVAGRLVGQQDERLAPDCARHRNTLLLSARQLARQMLGAVPHAHAFERRQRVEAALRRFHPAVGERQLDVLQHR